MSRTSPAKSIDFEQLLIRVTSDYPDIKFIEGKDFSWNHDQKSIYYNKNSKYATFDLLHELGHIELDHVSYSSDLSLLKKELEAWEIAKNIAQKFNISISENYINKCIESYRLWIHKRSLCSKCFQNALEISEKKYKCINCNHTWQVSSAQESRVYRKSLDKPDSP